MRTPRKYAVMCGSDILRSFSESQEALRYLRAVTIDGKSGASCGCKTAVFDRERWKYVPKKLRRSRR